MIAALVFLFSATADADNNKRSMRSWLPEPVGDTDYYDEVAPDVAKVQLGAQLFFDKILSGNLNISCATCHHPFANTADGLSLPVGEGGRGIGVTRDNGNGNDTVRERVPRNAPALFNVGAREFTSLFHDGRVQLNAMFPNGIELRAGFDLPEGLVNPLAVQAIFSVTSDTEMAGQAGENPIANTAAAGNFATTNGVWAQLAERHAARRLNSRSSRSYRRYVKPR